MHKGLCSEPKLQRDPSLSDERETGRCRLRQMTRMIGMVGWVHALANYSELKKEIPMKTTVRGRKSMRTQAVTVLMMLVIVGFSAIAQTTSTTEGQALAGKCDKLEADKAALMKEKNGLLDEEKRLQQEDSDLKREVTRLRNAKLEFKMDGDAVQQDMNNYNAECGGSHPRSVYERLRPKCEPWGARIDTKTADLGKKAGELTASQNNIDSRQANLYRDTLDLTRKTKENDAKISDVRGKLEEAQSKTIAAALKDLRMRKQAGEACKAIKNLEQLSCCNSVVWDQKDPHNCGVANVYQVFRTAGVFGTPVVVPGKRPT